mgnify:CR=1 FL=1
MLVLLVVYFEVSIPVEKDKLASLWAFYLYTSHCFDLDCWCFDVHDHYDQSLTLFAIFFSNVWLTRYRSTPSTPHNVGRSSRRTEPRTAVSSSSAAAATTKTTKRKGGLLAKMKSLGGLKKGASRTGGGATRSSTRTTRSSRSGGIGAGASRTGGGRWNWGFCCVVLEGAGDCIILDRYKADWTKWTEKFLKIKMCTPGYPGRNISYCKN